MYLIFKHTLLVLLLACPAFQQKVPEGKNVKCSYFGEPHLIPFPTVAFPIQNQYVCRPIGKELLIYNQFLSITVSITASGNHPINAYTVTVFPSGPYTSACVITDNLAASSPIVSCSSTSGATVTIVGSSVYVDLLAEDIHVTIDNSVKCFDIYITQPEYLVDLTKGVCVEWDCEEEISGVGRKKRQAPSNPVISRVCDTYISNATEAVQSNNRNLIKRLSVVCNHDIGSTLDALFSRTIVTSLVRDGIVQQGNGENNEEQWQKVSAVAKLVTAIADSYVNEIIKNSDPVCQRSEDGGRQCLDPIGAPDQGRRRRLI